jgi:endoglucanase
MLHCPACDDLAALAAALAALDVLRKRKGCGHVGVLLTVAEEVGFIGAIAACKQKSVPRGTRLICLENSRSFPESPIGDGPILRVGDRMSVFTPDLTNQISEVLRVHAEKNGDFKYQRKLMPGGTCEATTFASYGYQSTCVCLPLGNYHNMSEIDEVLAGKRPARVAPECIAVADYHGMVEMLIVCAEQIDEAKVPALRGRMERLYDEYGHVVE